MPLQLGCVLTDKKPEEQRSKLQAKKSEHYRVFYARPFSIPRGVKGGMTAQVNVLSLAIHKNSLLNPRCHFTETGRCRMHGVQVDGHTLAPQRALRVCGERCQDW